MLIEQASAELGWPGRSEVFEPQASERRVVVDLAREKLGPPLTRAGADVKVGVLPADPAGNTTESPLALICEFHRQPTAEQLDLAHKLAWNFCRTRLLITLECQRLRAWSCCVPPTAQQDRIIFDDAPSDLVPPTSLTDTALHALHWVSLVTGDFFQQRESAFRGWPGRLCVRAAKQQDVTHCLQPCPQANR